MIISINSEKALKKIKHPAPILLKILNTKGINKHFINLIK